MLFDINGLWVNDEEKIYYINAKHKDTAHINCRKITEDIQPRLKSIEKELIEKGYKKVYADRFEKYRKYNNDFKV